MLISHEVPRHYYEFFKRFNDYDYALAHLFEYEDYSEFFKNSLKESRIVFLDNSVFELGVAFDIHKFVQLSNELHQVNKFNLISIIPDVLDNTEETLENVKIFKELSMPVKTMGVLQGNTIKELKECYDEMKEKVDIIGVNHISKAFFTECGNNASGDVKSQERMKNCFLINSWAEEDNKWLHSLGVILPREAFILGGFKQFKSIDTSNPVIHGYQQIPYENVIAKPNIKLNDIFQEKLNLNQIEHIITNMQKFRFFANGKHI